MSQDTSYPAEQGVVTVIAIDDVVTVPARQSIVSVTADEQVVSATAYNTIVARSRVNCCVSARNCANIYHIITIKAHDDQIFSSRQINVERANSTD